MAVKPTGLSALQTHPVENEARKAARQTTEGAIASILKKNKNIENRHARERIEYKERAAVKKKAAEKAEAARKKEIEEAERNAGKRAVGAVGAAWTARVTKMAEAKAEAAKKAKANNEAIFAGIGNQYTNMNNNKLPEAKRILAYYRKLHFQLPSKNNQRIKNLRSKVKEYEASQKVQKKIQSQTNIAASLNAIKNNTQFIHAYNKLGIIGRRSLRTSNKEKLDTRYRSAKAAKKNEATEKKGANNAEEQQRLTNLARRLLDLPNNNLAFLTEYKQLGIFGRRKFAPGNKQELNAKYTRIMKTAAAKAKANKNAAAAKAKANKNAANRISATRKMQINSQLNEYLKYVNAATIKQRIPTNLNGPFNGWRKVANKEKLRLLEAKLRPVPVFNNAALRKSVNNYFSGTQEIYNKAVIRAILAHPTIQLTNNQRNQLQRKLQTRAGRFAGALGRGAALAGRALGRGAGAAGGALGSGAVVAGRALGRGAGAAGGALGSGAVVAGRALGRGAGAAVAYLMKPRIEKLIEIINNPRTRRGERENAIRELYAISKDLRTRMNNKTKAETFLGTLGNLNSIVKGQKAPGLVSQVLGPSSTNFLPVEYVKNSNGNYIINSNGKRKAAPPPLGYVLKSYYNKNGNQTPGYFKIKNSKTLQSQLEYMGNGPRRNNYGNRYGYNRGGSGPSAPSGGIVFAPKINVGAARIGAQTFGGTRVGGQQMGGSRVRTGNAGSTTLKTGNTGGVQVSNLGKANVGTRPANAGLTVSAPTTNGSRQLAATSEQLIRGAGGAEAVEKGIKALNAANGNVARAKAASKLPTNTFTNIYAMGGPVAAKKAVAARRRRRTVGGRRVGTGTRGAPGKKKRVAPKPRKQYIKLTPYQFRRLTDHIKKNNLRKVLIKEITH